MENEFTDSKNRQMSKYYVKYIVRPAYVFSDVCTRTKVITFLDRKYKIAIYTPT